MLKENFVSEINSDRVGTLPEDVTIYILSFLDTKSAVQTSVLSKRWEKLWNLVPDLYFDSEPFKKASSFVKFVQGVLTHRNQSININNFSFMSWGKSMYDVQKFIDYAVSHNVQHLVLTANKSRMPDRQFNLYSADTLKTLKLKYIKYPTTVLCFPQLVNLQLEMSELDCCDPFSGCPNLKNLTMIRCTYEGRTPFKILAPQLSNLALSFCEFYFPRPSQCNTIELTMPRLTSFRYERSAAPVQFKSVHLPCVANVYIDLDVSDSCKYPEMRLLNLTSLLQQLHNASSVTLSMSTVKFLSRFPDELAKEASPFRNLKKLSIVYPPWPKSSQLSRHVENFFLKNSPSSEIFVEFRWRMKRNVTR